MSSDLSQSGGEGVDLLFHLRNLTGLLLYLVVFLQKLIQQHRVHCFIADGVDLAVIIAYHQVRIYLCYFFSNRPYCGVAWSFFLYWKVTGLSPRMASLVLSIGLISFLNRRACA